jgi:hypothetical protein
VITFDDDLHEERGKDKTMIHIRKKPEVVTIFIIEYRTLNPYYSKPESVTWRLPDSLLIDAV